MINYLAQFMVEHNLEYGENFIYHGVDADYRCHFTPEYGRIRLFAATKFICQEVSILEEIMNGKGWVEVKEEQIC